MPGRNSEIINPVSSTFLNNDAFCFGYTISIPQPKTAIGFPPSSNAVLCATESIP